MKKKTRIVFALLSIGGVATLLMISYFTFRVVSVHPNISYYSKPNEKDIYRIMFISGDSGSPFWDQIKEGAQKVANDNKVAIEFQETFQTDIFGYLKNIDKAIASRVDGIIVQGKEDPEFIEIVNKALQKGIPVITVFTDAPDSLRKTYVGPNHFQEGIIIGEHIALQLEGKGKIGIIYGGPPVGYLSLRRQGVEKALAKYPDIEILEASKEHYVNSNSIKETTELLNQYPDCKVLLGLTEEAMSEIVQVIKGRSRLQHYSIYSFDQNPEISVFIENGVVSAAIGQFPEEMGSKSTTLMLRWLAGIEYPLEQNYYTSIQLITNR
ncbi:sugar ABC transporter substrate-binding protein [Neobacillus notoginsengisoli]|uniref:Sugar ABC transporter substrate-binding protein n=1 Tax=Neobacillus notoginsengisoli TaxID=1578198 RepID=A0A417YIK5_9BACI|nr:substrate-binding domain-containing protein [Neobacillus notoginsengisoli]RHW32810.1 sugar ABC transporter substrate-binding protein [Neobacillus notoginsengisoli]